MREVGLVRSCAITRSYKTTPAQAPVPKVAGKIKPACTMSTNETIMKTWMRSMMISSTRLDATKLARVEISITKTMFYKRIIFSKMIAT